jgi:hypothetical protein
MWCGEKLRWDLGFSLLECALLGILIMWLPFVIAFWVWPTDYAPWLGGLLVLILEIPITVVFVLIRVVFFPSPVKKDSGWPDDGTILHITNPPEPPRKSQQ